MLENQKIAKDIYLIDTRVYSIPGMTSIYLLAEENMALIDTGSATSMNTVLDGIRNLGFDPIDIKYIIATHIHLDHSGGAGALLSHMPQAKVLVHENGAKHLIDPSRLIKSLELARGKQALKKDGLPVPIEPKRVSIVKNNEVIKLSEEQELKILYTPGHAKHHICIYESKNRGLFIGEASGACFPEEKIVIPTTPLPDFDLYIAIDTIRKLLKINIDLLFFAHFGFTRDVKLHLQKAIRTLETWGEIVQEAASEGDPNKAAERLRGQAIQELHPIRENKAIYDFIITDIVPASIAGYLNYFRRQTGTP